MMIHGLMKNRLLLSRHVIDRQFRFTGTLLAVWLIASAMLSHRTLGQEKSGAEQTKNAVDTAADFFGPSATAAGQKPPSEARPADTPEVGSQEGQPDRQTPVPKKPGAKSGNILDSLFQIFRGSGDPEESAETMPPASDDTSMMLGVEPFPGSGGPSDARPNDQVIKVVSGYEEGMRLAQLNRRPLLVLLGAEWCVWCRKLEAELETPAAQPILKKWIVCKVDVDDDPASAQKFEAASLPGLRIIGFGGDVSASREGYLPASELEAWLDENLEKVDPTMQKVLFEQRRPSAADMKKLVEFLGHRRPAVRTAAQERLEAHPATSAGSLVDALRNGTLVQQLSALEVLERLSAPVTGLDPWKPETLENVDWQPLIDWSRGVAETKDGKKDRDDTTQSKPKVDDRTLTELLNRLSTAEGSRRESLLVEASSLGDAVIGPIRARLVAEDSLTDAEKQTLRELLYRSAAGRSTRLEFAALLNALSRLDAQTRRDAALRLCESLTSEDQSLIEELARDADPVVREAAVAAENNTGGLRSKQRVSQLLADADANVRSAVLRVLLEKSSPAALEAVVDHIGREKNEDLLVLSVKVLASGKENHVGVDAIINLLSHERWRVRAAALDACKQMSADSYGMGSPVTAEDSKKLFSAILKNTDDTDEFVAATARTLLPALFDSGTADVYFSYLSSHPDELNRLQIDGHDWSMEQRKQFLVTEAGTRLKKGNDADLNTAVAILAALAPEELKFELPKILQSSSKAMRIAGLRTIPAVLAIQRDKEVKANTAGWLVQHRIARKRKGSSSLKPWFPVPDEFMKLNGRTEELQDAGSTETTGSGTETPLPEPTGIGTGVASAAARASAPVIIERANPEQDAALDAAASLFGSTQASSASGTAGNEKNQAMAPSAEAPKSEEALDAAASLFGQPPPLQSASRASAPVREAPVLVSPAATADGNSSLQGEVTLDLPIPSPPIEVNGEFIDPSSADPNRPVTNQAWLDAWWKKTARTDSEMAGYAWIKEAAPLIDQLRNSEDKETALWADFAWYVIGHVELRPKIVEAAKRAAKEAGEQKDVSASREAREHAPRCGQYLPWIDADSRREILSDVIPHWTEYGADQSKFMSEALAVEDSKTGEWLFNLWFSAEVRSVPPTPLLHSWLVMAYGGKPAHDQSYWASALPSYDEAFHGVEDALPTDEEAMGLITHRFQTARSDKERIAALALASRFDFLNASATAVGIVSNAREWNELVERALMLALADSPVLSARRAALWLSHPLPQIREAALAKLLVEQDPFSSDLSSDGFMQMYLYTDGMTNLMYLLAAPENLAGPPAAEQSEKEQALRACLKLAVDKNADWKSVCSDLEKQVIETDTARLDAGLCMALGKRTDDQAMDAYRSIAEELSSTPKLRYLYQGLKRLPGKSGEELRSELRKKYGSAVMQQNGYPSF